MDALLTNTALWGLLLGLFTPLLTAVVQQPTFSKTVRTLVGLLTAAIVGVLTVLANGQLDNGKITVATLLVVVSASKVAYDKLWQRTPVTSAIEFGTSPGY